MTQIVDFSMEEVTLGWLKLETTLPKSLKHGSQSGQVFFLCAGVDDDII